MGSKYYLVAGQKKERNIKALKKERVFDICYRYRCVHSVCSRTVVGVPVLPALSSQVKLLITNNSFCIVQRATAQPKKDFFFVIMVFLKLLRGFKPAGLTAPSSVTSPNPNTKM
jgi:hypothetical protein